MCCSLEKGKTAVKRQIVATVDSYQHRGVLSLNPLGDLNLLSALFGVKVMQPSGKLQLVRWRSGLTLTRKSLRVVA